MIRMIFTILCVAFSLFAVDSTALYHEKNDQGNTLHNTEYLELENVIKDIENPKVLKNYGISDEPSKRLDTIESREYEVYPKIGVKTDSFELEDVIDSENRVITFRKDTLSSAELNKNVTTTSVDTVQNKRSISKFSISMYAGGNMAFMTGSYIDSRKSAYDKMSILMSGHWGIRLNRSLNDWLSVSVGSRLIGKGNKAILFDTANAYAEYNAYNKYRTVFMEFPVTTHFSRDFGHNGKIYGFGGLALGYALKSNITIYDEFNDDERELESIDYFEPGILIDSLGNIYNLEYKDERRSVDISLLVGGGITLPFSRALALFLEGTYTHGLIDHYRYSDEFSDYIYEVSGVTLPDESGFFRTFTLSIGLTLSPYDRTRENYSKE